MSRGWDMEIIYLNIARIFIFLVYEGLVHITITTVSWYHVICRIKDFKAFTLTLGSFILSTFLQMFPDFLGRGIDKYIPFRGKHSVFCCQHYEQLCISILTAAYYKKKFLDQNWVYGYKHTYLGRQFTVWSLRNIRVAASNLEFMTPLSPSYRLLTSVKLQ